MPAKIARYLFLTLLAFALFACEDDDDLFDPSNADGIVGTWQLVESLADPGDGSGRFRSVDSDRRITFATDSTYTANAVICDFDLTTIDTDTPTTGTYDPVAMALFPNDCRNVAAQPTPVTAAFDGRELVLSYFCIEPCRHKYVRLR